MITPRLRFPGFSGGWEEVKLGDIAKFAKGSGISKADIVIGGKTRAIRYGELYTRYSEIITEVASSTDADIKSLVLSKKNDVIIPASGETHIDIATASCVIDEGIALSGDINIIRSDNDGVFLSYYLNNTKKYDIARLGQGVSVVHLYPGSLRLLKLNLPKRAEQKKIADFLSVVDEGITAIDKKVELLKQYKKGVMQKIFTQQIRFKDENGQNFPGWQTKKLGDILDYEQPTKYIVKSTDYDDRCKTPVLTAGKTFVLGYTDETGGIFSSKLPVIIFDDFTTASHFVDFPFKVKSSAMKILKAKSGVNTKIAYELLKRIKFSADDHKRYWIGTFQDFDIELPSEEEQQKIAEFLTSLDDKIKLTEEKLAQAKAYKKSLLQRMFV